MICISAVEFIRDYNRDYNILYAWILTSHSLYDKISSESKKGGNPDGIEHSRDR